jgi:tetraacyldisaccharide 4'-kinase
VLVFDERGAGNGRLLPAGPLRERIPQALGPRQIALYNADARRPACPATWRSAPWPA